MTKETKIQTTKEEILNTTSHGLMTIFGIVSLILLIIKSSTTIEVVASVIFGTGIILLYSMSTMYHAMPQGTAKRVFRRFDHLSIYILIGGSFAPFLLLLEGLKTPLFGIEWMQKGLTLFIIQWILIAIGIISKSIWIKKFAKLHVFLYLAMGWSGLTFVTVLAEYSKQSFYLVLFGGLAYTIGVIFYTQPKIKYFHFIWHLFTAIGTILHFLAIYNYLL